MEVTVVIDRCAALGLLTILAVTATAATAQDASDQRGRVHYPQESRPAGASLTSHTLIVPSSWSLITGSPSSKTENVTE